MSAPTAAALLAPSFGGTMRGQRRNKAKKVLTKYAPLGKLKGLLAFHGCQVLLRRSGSAFLLVG